MKVPALSFEPSVTRLFGNGDIGLSGLVRGWASPEDAHLWNDGAVAIMELTLPLTERRYTLEFEGEPFIDSDCRSQELTVYCNGFWIGFWKLEERKSYTLFTHIEAEQLFVRQTSAFVQLVWMLPNSTRPVAIKWNDDGRRLGFCFRALTFRQADELIAT